MTESSAVVQEFLKKFYEILNNLLIDKNLNIFKN